MSDDLDALKAFLADTPAPDEAKKRAHIALAEKNFEHFQGSQSEARLTSESSPKTVGWISGVRHMLNVMTSRAGLALTTSIAAVGVGIFFFAPNELPQPLERAKTAAPDTLAIETQEMASDAPVAELLVGSAALRSHPAPAPMGIQIVDDFAPFPLEASSEEFANEAPGALKTTQDDPVSTFSIDVDTASYSIVRSSLTNGTLPPKDAVRIEEMINYFPYDYEAPTGDAPFSQNVTVMNTPWNTDTQLVHIGIQGALPVTEDRPPLNLVFLIDTSGSMQDINKLPLLKQSFRLMLGQLRPDDQIAIVTYAGSAGQVLEPTPASESSKILAALDQLEAGGSTAGQAGLQQAYDVAQSMQEDGEVTRVLLATDGDFNVGIHDPEALKSYIESKRDQGSYLSVLGFGRGNLDDATMQALAQNGNGQAAYIDTLAEAQKVLVDQLTGALFPIADDVKIQVEFNPAEVAEYRLIGYETRALNREDFNNDKVDAGEIGAGHNVTAIYEITPVGSPAIKNDELRYSATTVAPSQSDELGFLKLRYKRPGESTSELITQPITEGMGTSNLDTEFATAIAGFGQLLRDDTYLVDWGWDDAIALAQSAKGDDPFGYRAEAVTLMRLAKSLSE
ncbi:von Willebrand factor type A domain-containing protein [Falsihalocynthiibacter sp. SS001]|uniref:vWA domain-containing protein n=1 Tax=Falsihalocynthiibacter sp. SS001 TaxID=3349698 RepID=UPI0036D277E3